MKLLHRVTLECEKCQWPTNTFCAFDTKQETRLPKGAFRHIANIHNVETPDEAYELTNNGSPAVNEHTETGSWVDMPQVTLTEEGQRMVHPESGSLRSTSVGDIIIDEEWIWSCDSFGWREVREDGMFYIIL